MVILIYFFHKLFIKKQPFKLQFKVKYHNLNIMLNMLLISNTRSYMLRKKLMEGFVSRKQLEVGGRFKG